MADPVFNNTPLTGTVGEPYSFVWSITADSPPSVYIVGTLPAGLILSDNVDNYNPVISGTPEASGVFDFSAIVTEAENGTSKKFVITIRSECLFKGYYPV